MNSADAAEMMALSSAAGEGGCGSAGPSSPTLQCQQNPFPPTRPERKRCRPTVSLLMITVFLTLLGTAALTASIFTDYWERIDYNSTAIETIARRHNGSHRLTWLFNSTVARIVLQHPSSIHSSQDSTTSSKSSSSRSWTLKRGGAVNASTSSNSRTADHSGIANGDHYANSIIDRPASQVGSGNNNDGNNNNNNKVKRSLLLVDKPSARWMTFNKSLLPHRRKKRSRRLEPAGLVYLIPLHGGIWHLCVDLNGEQLKLLQEMGLNREELCMDYLDAMNDHAETASTPVSRLSAHYLHYHVQSKMHNLSISCAMVCVILLGSAALLGTFGIIKRQLSAILVTGVMYILAALFAVFSLVIMHCKRNARRESGIVDDLLVSSTDYNESRIFTNSWSMLLGWIGSILILLASFLWLFLAKVMRYNPLTF